jgi:hypothetical protein
MFKVGGMIRSPSKTLDTKEGMQTTMRLLNEIPCNPLKDMLFTKSLCTLEDALKGVGHVYKFGSSFHKIKLDARRNSKEVRSKTKETCGPYPTRRKIQKLEQLQNKGTKHINFLSC